MWIVPLGAGQPRSLGPKTRTALISPDGSKILVSSLTPGEGGLFRLTYEVVPAAGGAAITSIKLPEQATNVAWGPDSGSVTFCDQADAAWNICRVRLTGGKPEPITHFTEGRCIVFQWSPDGSRLAVSRTIGDDTNLWITAADGSKPVQATRFPGDSIFDLQWTRDGKSVVVNAGKRSSDAVLIRSFR
jgi:Tol biopolymer transport system component